MFRASHFFLFAVVLLSGCAATTTPDDLSAEGEQAVVAAPGISGSYVNVSGNTALDSIAAIELTANFEFDATVRVATACAGEDCGLIHEKGRYHFILPPGGSKMVVLTRDNGDTRSFRIGERPDEITLTDSSTTTTLRPAQWGGRGLSLTLDANGGSLRFDCASGYLDGPLVIDPSGAFHARGTFHPETGVMLPPDAPPLPTHTVIFHGIVGGSAMDVSFRLPGAATQTFHLDARSQGTLNYCL